LATVCPPNRGERSTRMAGTHQNLVLGFCKTGDEFFGPKLNRIPPGRASAWPLHIVYSCCWRFNAHNVYVTFYLLCSFAVCLYKWLRFLIKCGAPQLL